MGKPCLCFVLFLCGTHLLGCGGGGRGYLSEETPLPEGGPTGEPLAPPVGKFPVPETLPVWTPETPGSGLASEFVKALQDQESVALILPSGLTNAQMEDRVYQMVRKAAPATKVVARGRGVLDQLLEERGEIPYRVTLEPGGTDVLGRPYYLPREHPLNTDWLAESKPLKGAKALLTVRPLQVDEQKMRELRRRREGGCEEAEAVLKEATERAPVFFRPLEAASLATLAGSFRRHLTVALPFWREELETIEREQMPGSLGHRCVEAYNVFLQGYEACLTAECPIGPKIYATGRGVVGMVDTSQLIPEGCPTQGMRDYKSEIVFLGTRATQDVLSAFDRGWPGELLRYGGVERVQRALNKFCASRHRRIHVEDLARVQEGVERFFEKLRSEELEGSWQMRKGLERVPQVGPIHILARVQVAGVDPVQEADALRTEMRRIEHCIEGDEDLLQAAIIDVGTSEVHFMGIFFEEELLCDGFQPGFP